MDTKALIVTLSLSGLLSAATAVGVATKSTASPPDDKLAEVVEELSSLRAQFEDQQRDIRDLRQQLAEQSGRDRGSNQVAIPIVSDANMEGPTAEEEADDDVDDNQNERTMNQNRSISRQQTLIQRGFSTDEALWILQTEAEVQLQSLNEQYRARRARVEQELANGTRAKSRFEQLKEKLGEDYYERYLKANGLPIDVGVRSVLEKSPGANAGLLAGDRIVSYDGKRVYNIRELNSLTIEGQVGQSVLLEIMRDGNPQQVTLPRGPIGIVSRR